jgi:hypothetical protein
VSTITAGIPKLIYIEDILHREDYETQRGRVQLHLIFIRVNFAWVARNLDDNLEFTAAGGASHMRSLSKASTIPHQSKIQKNCLSSLILYHLWIFTIVSHKQRHFPLTA